MRNQERIKRILELIEKIWNENPDLRFNQMIEWLQWEFSKRNDNIYNYTVYKKNGNKDCFCFEEHEYVDLFYTEDEQFEEFLQQLLEEIENTMKN